jgi:hypothetical protein
MRNWTCYINRNDGQSIFATLWYDGKVIEYFRFASGHPAFNMDDEEMLRYMIRKSADSQTKGW